MNATSRLGTCCISAVFVASAAALSCSSTEADAGASGASRRTDAAAVHVEGQTFRDGQGRQLLFRGYNAKVNGIFDVTFADGRTPNYTFPSFDEASAQRFEDLGFDVMRLTVNWSALEPSPNTYPDAFFEKVDAILDMGKRHHFYVILDMHQDGYSKEIGEDGAPLWAIMPQPAQVLSGPSNDDRRLTDGVLQAGYNFFANVPATDGRPLQEAYITAVKQMTKRYAKNAVVLGYEAMNEPVVIRAGELDAFHQRFADGIHAVDADAPVLFEPMGFRNQMDRAPIPGDPWKNGAGVYAPHIYTGQFSVPSQNGWESEDPAVLAPSMAAADVEAKAWATPLFVTEFGCNVQDARGSRWMAAELDLQDRYLASSTAWAWEPGSWGIRDDAVVERPETARVMARPYPRAVAGDLLAIERPAAGRLVVRYRATPRTRGLPHEVSVSKAHLTSYEVYCDDVKVADAPPAGSSGRTEIVCPATEGEHTFEVRGTPVPAAP